MDLPGGQLIVGVVGLAIIGYGGSLVYRGWTEKFREHLDAQGQAGKDGSAYVTLGKVGYIAKGIAIAIVGGLFCYAAITHDPKKSGGLDQALQTVLEQPFGQVLLTAIALGIAAYGAVLLRAGQAPLALAAPGRAPRGRGSPGGDGQGGGDHVVAHLLDGDAADPRHARLLLRDPHRDPTELEGAEPAGIQHVGEQPRVVDVEVAALRARGDRAGQHRQAPADGLPEAVHRALADLLEQVAAGAPHDGLRAVDERGVGQAVVHERLDQAYELVARLVGDGGRPPSATRSSSRYCTSVRLKSSSLPVKWR